MPKRTRLKRGSSKARSTRMTKIPMKKDFDIFHKYFGIERDGNNYKVRLGNWTDAGWFWDGDKSDLGMFMVRITHSDFRETFAETMKKNGVQFSSMKQDILNSINKGDSGMYALSGDNVVWHFGEDYIDDQAMIEEKAEDSGVSVDELQNKVYDYYSADEFEDFKNTSPDYDVLKKELVSAVERANSWDELMQNLNSEDLRYSGMEAVHNYQSAKFITALDKAVEEIKKK